MCNKKTKEQGERKANLMTEITIATWNVEYALMRRMTSIKTNGFSVNNAWNGLTRLVQDILMQLFKS